MTVHEQDNKSECQEVSAQKADPSLEESSLADPSMTETSLAGRKLLAIDYGLARTGIAVTDSGGRMAFPRCTVYSPPQSSRQIFFEKLLACIERESPYALVVGLPLHADGSESMTTRQVRNFVLRLQRRTKLPIYLMPELLSSAAAADDLRVCGVSLASRGKKRDMARAVLDQQAAVHILQSFLSDPQQEKRRV